MTYTPTDRLHRQFSLNSTKCPQADRTNLMIVLPITYKVLHRPQFRSATAYSVVKVQSTLANLTATFLPSESSYGYPAWVLTHTNAVYIILYIQQRNLFLSQ